MERKRAREREREREKDRDWLRPHRCRSPPPETGVKNSNLRGVCLSLKLRGGGILVLILNLQFSAPCWFFRKT